MNIIFKFSWEYDKIKDVTNFTIAYNEIPEMLFHLEHKAQRNEVILDVEKPMFLENLQTLLNSVWFNTDKDKNTQVLTNNREVPIKSFVDEDNFPKNSTIYSTANYIKLTDRSILNLSNGHLMTDGKLFDRYVKKDVKSNKPNPIKEYTKRPDKVYAIQYKMYNKKAIENFVGKCYNNDGTFYIITDTEELIVDYGSFVVKEGFNFKVYTEEEFKEKYY